MMSSYCADNIFAKILRKEIPCQQVAQTDHSLAFHDIHPQAPIHILVIPKGSYGTLADFINRASGEEIADFFALAQKVMKDYGLWEDSARMIINQGTQGGQEVFHFHMHLLGGWKKICASFPGTSTDCANV